MPSDLSSVVGQLGAAFPDLDSDVVLRQVTAAAESVQFFGLDVPGNLELVERLARSHLESLDDLRTGRAEAD